MPDWTPQKKSAYLRKLPREKAEAWIKANPTELEVLGLYVFPKATTVSEPPSISQHSEKLPNVPWNAWRSK